MIDLFYSVYVSFEDVFCSTCMHWYDIYLLHENVFVHEQ